MFLEIKNKELQDTNEQDNEKKFISNMNQIKPVGNKKIDDMFYENYLTKIMDDHLKCYDFNELLKVFNKCKN